MRMDFSTIQVGDNDHIPDCENCRFLLVLKGQGSLSFDNKLYALNPHDFLELPSQTDCVYKSEDGKPLLLGVIELLEITFSSHKIMQIPAKDTDLIRRVFFLGLDVQGMGDAYLNAVKETLHRLLHETVLAVGLKTKAMNQQVFDIIMDINEHFTDPDFDVTASMQRTSYSVNHLRKLFKAETGITPVEFVNMRRMDKAGELFRHMKNRIPVKEIALQCGYQDPYYFSRQFKTFFGVSPQNYVEQLIKECNDEMP